MITLPAHEAVTPVGKPVAVPIPVARVVVWVIEGNGVFIQSVGVVDGGPATISGTTVIVPMAVFKPPVQPPVIVTV